MSRLVKYINPYVLIKKIFNKYKKKKLLGTLKNVGSLEIDINRQRILTPSLVSVGNEVFMGEDIYIAAEVNIGDRVMFGPHCLINGGDHIFGVLGKYPRNLKPEGRENSKVIIIEEDVWCGARTIILKGVIIGKGAVIGAGSVVSKNIPPYTVAVGNPCKPIKKIFNDEELFQHLKICGYNEDVISEVIKKRKSYFD
jgi:acetyltransferase-like isoleucine patch superfamily enzyme